MPRWLGLTSPAMSSTVSGTTPSHYDGQIKLLFPDRPLEAVFTITLGCSVIERRLEPMPMSGRSDMEDSLGQQDFAPDRDRDRDLRSAPRAWTGPPACRHGPGAADLAALPA